MHRVTTSDEPSAIDDGLRPRVPTLGGRLLAWQRRVLFREETWHVEGTAPIGRFDEIVEAAADDGLPLLMTLPKLPFNRVFVGRKRDGRIALKHRTHPLLWLIGPGSYFFAGQIVESNIGTSVSGVYRLRPTLAWMYHAYFAIGAAFLAISFLAVLLGAGLWMFVPVADSAVLESGVRMTLISCGYLALGWGHIGFEKWLDARNRHAVRRLLESAAAGRATSNGPVAESLHG